MERKIRKVNRRDFLRLSVATLGVITLIRCSSQESHDEIDSVWETIDSDQLTRRSVSEGIMTARAKRNEINLTATVQELQDQSKRATLEAEIAIRDAEIATIESQLTIIDAEIGSIATSTITPTTTITPTQTLTPTPTRVPTPTPKK